MKLTLFYAKNLLQVHAMSILDDIELIFNSCQNDLLNKSDHFTLLFKIISCLFLTEQ